MSKKTEQEWIVSTFEKVTELLGQIETRLTALESSKSEPEYAKVWLIFDRIEDDLPRFVETDLDTAREVLAERRNIYGAAFIREAILLGRVE